MTRFKPEVAILPEEQRVLWPLLASAKQAGFTLYGGTAIALRLGHRTSVDFDFFTEDPLRKPAIYQAMPFLKGAEVLKESSDTVLFSVVPPKLQNPVKLSFFATIAFGRYGEPELTEDGILRVASLDDLMGTKLKVILDRVEKRDYEDLAAMITAGVSVARGLGIARKMFPLNPEMALKALAYHKDLPGLAAHTKKMLVNAAKNVKSIPDVEMRSRSLSEKVIHA